ncbi:MAG: hypothetical protein Alpg2KO_14380 [Alphaproteobacteria bacterium]
MTIDTTLTRIRSYFQHKGWSAHRVGVECGVSYIAVRSLFDPEFSPTLTTLRKLEAVIPDHWTLGDPVSGHAQIVPADPIIFTGFNICQVNRESDQ